MRSRSTWACELKFWKARQAERHDVTLHVSVWVEIQILHRVRQRDNASRSTWACELKCLWVEIRRTWFPGHAPRERVSWNPFQTCQHSVECVTLHVSVWVEIWNERHRGTGRGVTLHVSVWVEILCVTCAVEFMSHAPRERVSWNRKIWSQSFKALCHAPRERVSWNDHMEELADILSESRSTWACELKCMVCNANPRVTSVTLHVSVWVEIFAPLPKFVPHMSRSTWACELKWINPLKIPNT